MAQFSKFRAAVGGGITAAFFAVAGAVEAHIRHSNEHFQTMQEAFLYAADPVSVGVALAASALVGVGAEACRMHRANRTAAETPGHWTVRSDSAASVRQP